MITTTHWTPISIQDEDGDPITPNEYLEQALAPQSGTHASVQERNRVRQNLRSFFHPRDCAVFVRPVADEGMIQRLDELSVADLRPEFQTQLRNLTDDMFDPAKLEPKTLKGKPLSGAMLGSLVKTYVQAMNAGSIPTISTVRCIWILLNNRMNIRQYYQHLTMMNMSTLQKSISESIYIIYIYIYTVRHGKTWRRRPWRKVWPKSCPNSSRNVTRTWSCRCTRPSSWHDWISSETLRWRNIMSMPWEAKSRNSKIRCMKNSIEWCNTGLNGMKKYQKPIVKHCCKYVDELLNI